jgi:hypothetical protein
MASRHQAGLNEAFVIDTTKERCAGEPRSADLLMPLLDKDKDLTRCGQNSPQIVII